MSDTHNIDDQMIDWHHTDDYTCMASKFTWGSEYASMVSKVSKVSRVSKVSKVSRVSRVSRVDLSPSIPLDHWPFEVPSTLDILDILDSMDIMTLWVPCYGRLTQHGWWADTQNKHDWLTHSTQTSEWRGTDSWLTHKTQMIRWSIDATNMID